MVEAAASVNYYRTVWVLLTGGNMSSFDVFKHKVSSTVLYYENVKLRHLTLTEFFENSPLWAWFIHSGWETQSDRRQELVWQAVALLLLHKHGQNNHYTNSSRSFGSSVKLIIALYICTVYEYNFCTKRYCFRLNLK